MRWLVEIGEITSDSRAASASTDRRSQCAPAYDCSPDEIGCFPKSCIPDQNCTPDALCFPDQTCTPDALCFPDRWPSCAPDK